MRDLNKELGYTTKMPSLGETVWSQDDNNQLVGYSNAVGQATIVSILSPFSGLIAYPICSGAYKAQCTKCKAEAQSKPKSGWLRDGKENFMKCMERELAKIEIPTSSADTFVGGGSGSGSGGQKFPPAEVIENSVDRQQSGGLSTGAKIGIAVGGLALVGLIVVLAVRKKK